jgi:UDP-glucose 4-epimerase
VIVLDHGLGYMSILITWWLGYIGSHTAVVFANGGYEVVIVDNLSNSDIDVLEKINGLVPKPFSFYECDLRDKGTLWNIFEAHTIDAVIHFAAKKAVGESCEMPFDYYDNNILWSLSLFELMDKHDVKKIVFSSSATVYAPDGTPPFVETDRLDTTNPYGTTKLVIEYLLKDMAAYKWFHVVCLRYFNPIGAHQDGAIGENPNGTPNNLLPYIFKVASGILPDLKVFGNDYPTIDGTGIRDYIHVMDLAEAHIGAFQALKDEKIEKLKDGWWMFDAINLGTGKWISVLEMITMVQNITKTNIPYEIVTRRSGDVALSLANPGKANRILWWEAVRSVEDAIRDGRNFIQRYALWKK